MTLLLDSHAVVWFSLDDPRLPARVRSTLEADGTGIVSAASIWELEIKRAAGRLELDADLAERVLASGLQGLPITFEHAAAAARLPPHHGDPFGRMLIAQAQLEGLTLVTRDRRIRQYDVPVLWD